MKKRMLVKCINNGNPTRIVERELPDTFGNMYLVEQIHYDSNHWKVNNNLTDIVNIFHNAR